MRDYTQQDYTIPTSNRILTLLTQLWYKSDAGTNTIYHTLEFTHNVAE